MRISGNSRIRPIGVALYLLMILFLTPGSGWGKRTHDLFFQGTDYELHVYRIFGEEPGKTLLLIGGIQGNEPGGFLSADLYADMALARGKLIVVPRANFYSILLNRRQINEDMNRQFAEASEINYEAKIVAILKELISESDCLLNLHDGSGFFSEKWESAMRNPNRYGQSIIADSETHTIPETGKILHLGDMARQVAVQINRHIKEPGHRFHFNNHRTRNTDTLHPEQRKSATYYALFQCGIPAFGIETSKSLPLETKVRHHNFAINAFMELLGIVPESPGVYLDPPVMRYIAIAVNDKIPFAVPNGYTLQIRSGDMVRISHVEANYKRGLSADILDYGTVNDMHKPIQITRPTQVVVRKDRHPCGMINIVLDAAQLQLRTVTAVPEASFFKTRINGDERLFMNNAHVDLIKGDRFELIDVTTNLEDPSEVIVNFKGYVGNLQNNTGEDRGYVIHTGRDLWKRYSLYGEGKQYQIVVLHGETVLGRLFVRLADPVFEYVILQVDRGIKRCLFPGDSLVISPEAPIQILDIKTNISRNAGVLAFLKGSDADVPLFSDGEAFPWGSGSRDIGLENRSFRIVVQREHIILGSIFLDLEKGRSHGG
ncbi:MAG: hypothetical protein KAR36_06060 [Candidatus Latescibacteria bacterium]|nr:hypothetical protein [Candidatus Latescibacterota bacterium]